MGRPMLIHTIRTPLFNDDGQIEGIIGLGMDIGVGGGGNLLDMVGGLDPAIREALEGGVSRPAEIISLEKRRLVNGRQD